MLTNLRRLGITIAVLALPTACKSSTGPNPKTNCPTEFCVLFVGGSLEEWNNMPLMVEALGREGTRARVIVGTSFLGGSTLDDHLFAGAAQAKIETGNWNVVSLGQGPSSRSDSRALLRQSVGQFATIIKGAGATPALFMTWPRVENMADFPGASTSYRLAASDVNGILFPVADAWIAAWALDPTLVLYEDGWHPTVEGSYLAALVVHGTLFKRSVVGMPAQLTLSDGTTVTISEGNALILQLAADKANGGPP